MKTKHLLIISLVIGIALFAGATVYSGNSTITQKSGSSTVGSSNNVPVNQQGITVNEICSGVSCPFPNSPTVNTTI